MDHRLDIIGNDLVDLFAFRVTKLVELKTFGGTELDQCRKWCTSRMEERIELTIRQTLGALRQTELVHAPTLIAIAALRH